MHYTNTKKYLFTLAFFALSWGIFAQGPAVYNRNTPSHSTSDFWDNVRFGGGIGLNFGSGYFNGFIAPSAIYDVNQYVSLGTGLNLGYSDFNRQTAWIYGGSLLSFFNPVEFLQASVEFEQLWVNREIDRFDLPDISDNYDTQALFLGLGFRTRNVTVGVKYDLLHDSDSIYYDAWLPFVRVYF